MAAELKLFPTPSPAWRPAEEEQRAGRILRPGGIKRGEIVVWATDTGRCRPDTGFEASVHRKSIHLPFKSRRVVLTTRGGRPFYTPNALAWAALLTGVRLPKSWGCTSKRRAKKLWATKEAYARTVGQLKLLSTARWYREKGST